MLQTIRQGSFILFPLLLFFVSEAQGQLGFCGGNSGDPIFTETFGTGTTDGPPLPAGTTNYRFTTGTPSDGDYTVSSTTDYFDWHDTPDHTENDTDGKSFIVNADFTAGEFFRRTVNGLCENTSYEFSSWLINLQTSRGCGGAGIPVNVKFEIWDNTDTNLLASGDTGNIPNTSSPVWRPYGLVFRTVPGQTSVILKMTNNGNGGCGNDLAIDDIVFRTCGDFISITDTENRSNIAICDDAIPISTTLTANPDFSIYSTHAYQWQESFDGNNWADIPGENNQTYTTPNITTDTFYRVKIAEDAVNLANPLCSSLSEVFDILIIAKPAAPLSNGDVSSCENETPSLSVSVPNNVTANWYDAATGGTLLQASSSTYQPTTAGVYYAEASAILADCTSDTRTAVRLDIFPLPQLIDQTLSFCENSAIVLSADLDMANYLWNTGETAKEIEVDRAGIYSVLVTDTNGCAATKVITLEQIDVPKISNIRSEGYDIVIGTEENGTYEYSLDGLNYQTSNVLEAIAGGSYVIRVRENNGCGEVTQNFVHFVIPNFFTPNGDGINDLFIAEGIEFFDTSEVSIFDRFGKLLKQTSNAQISWNGTFNNKALPESDYWYLIRVDDETYKGHFSLKR